MLGLAVSVAKGGASLLTYVKDNLKLYLDFKSSRSDTLAFPSEGSTAFTDVNNQHIDCGVQIATDLGGSFNTAFTVSFWLYRTVTNNSSGMFYIGTFADTNGKIQIYTSTDTLKFRINNVDQLDISNFSANNSGWNHIAITWNASATTSIVYLNGVAQTPKTNSESSIAFTSSMKTIIGNYYGAGFPLNGKMANVGFWSRTLSLEEINSVMNKSYSQLGSVEKTSLVAWWALDQNELTAIHLDGANDKLENTSFTTHQTDTGTISGWFIFNDLTGTQRFFGVGGTAGDLTGAIRSLQVGTASLSFIGYGAADWDTTADLIVGNLYHLAITWNGDDIVVYVNGIGYSQTLSALVTPTGTNIRIGASVWQDQDNAHIKSISASVYTATLSESEVQSIYNNGHEVSEVGNNNIAHYWIMNNGSTVTDLVGSKNLTVTGATLVTNARQSDSKSTNHGVTIGATTTTSVYGGNAPILPRAIDIAESFADAIGNGSSSFDGSNSFIDIADNSVLDADSSDMTITFWYNPLSMSANMEIIDKYDTSSNKGYRVRHHNGTLKIFFQINDGDDSDGYYSYINQALSYGEWHHVAIAWDNSANTPIYYINGIVQGVSNQNGSTIGDVANSKLLRFGGTQANGSDYKGNLSQVGLWKGLLSQEMVQSLMESTSYAKIPADVKSTLGANLVTNSTFDSDISGWSQNNSSDSERTIAFATIDGRTCIDINDASSSNRFNAQFDLGSNAIDGELYKISYYVRKAQTGSTSKDFIVGLGFSNVGGDAGNVDKTVAEYDTWEFQEVYIICGSANNHLQFLSTAYDNANIGRLFLDDVKVQKVTNDLVAYYPLDADSEVKGLSFDGANDKITFTRQVFSGAFTVSWWFNGDTQTHYQRMFDDSVGNNNILIKDSNGSVVIRINTHYKALISGVPHNEWCHLAFTRDGSGNIKSYLNGVASGTSSSTDEFALDFIGEQCVCSMASASMYNVEKSASEVLSIYNDGIGGDESSNSGLVGYWKLDNASTVTDLSGNGNNGTVAGGATLISAGTTDSVGNNDGGLY